jgi:hypothetical protein
MPVTQELLKERDWEAREAQTERARLEADLQVARDETSWLQHFAKQADGQQGDLAGLEASLLQVSLASHLLPLLTRHPPCVLRCPGFRASKRGRV